MGTNNTSALPANKNLIGSKTIFYEKLTNDNVQQRE